MDGLGLGVVRYSNATKKQTFFYYSVALTNLRPATFALWYNFIHIFSTAPSSTRIWTPYLRMMESFALTTSLLRLGQNITMARKRSFQEQLALRGLNCLSYTASMFVNVINSIISAKNDKYRSMLSSVAMLIGAIIIQSLSFFTHYHVMIHTLNPQQKILIFLLSLLCYKTHVKV